MKIYLAGKITSNGWREAILTPGTMDRVRPHIVAKDWPIIARAAVLGQHDYTGPYFIPRIHDNHDPDYMDHDPGYHGPDAHGVDAQGERGCYGIVNHVSAGYTRGDVIDLCLSGIDKADVVFAWIDRADLYGSLVELGYAAAFKKPILIGYPAIERDLWFAWELATYRVCAESPRTALAELLKNYAPVAPQMKIDGYVYLLESGGVYKIGRAKVVDNRIKQIQPKLPHPIDVLHTIPCENMAQAESTLHARYRDYRLQGEWFNLPDSAVEEVKAIKSIALESRRSSSTPFVPGVKVRHSVFGEGVVVSSRAKGDETEVTVGFVSKGIKVLIAEFAGLKVAV